jgi:H+/gluconate symporter-like permease
VFSTLGVFVLFVNLQTLANTSPPLTSQTPVGTQNPNISPTDSPSTPEVDPSSQNTKDMGLTALVGSVITSITSLIGFVTTTVITWRKEKREASLTDVERKKLETELEKTKLELERLKKSKPKRKTKK